MDKFKNVSSWIVAVRKDDKSPWEMKGQETTYYKALENARKYCSFHGEHNVTLVFRVPVSLKGEMSTPDWLWDKKEGEE